MVPKISDPLLHRSQFSGERHQSDGFRPLTNGKTLGITVHDCCKVQSVTRADEHHLPIRARVRGKTGVEGDDPAPMMPGERDEIRIHDLSVIHRYIDVKW